MQPPSSQPKPNVLFLMTDHQRADSLRMVQAGVDVCPNVNRLAARSAVFQRAYNTCPLCVPARTALATGKYPTNNGVVFNDWTGIRAGDHGTIHEYLAAGGYDVAHVGVHHVRVRPEMRERVDFACWIDQTDWRRYLEQRGVDVPLAWGRDAFTKETHERQGDSLVAQRYTGTRTEVWPADGEHFLDRFWCRRAAEIIRQPRQRPLALFVCLWAPHPPLWLPEPYAGLFDPKRLELPANVGAVPEAEPPSRRRGVPAQLAEGVWPEHWRRVWAAHLGLVRLADDGLGEVLDALEATGQAERTIVVFTVDHGDLLGQHAMYQKMEMYEPAVRVPLVIRGPDIVPRRLATPVSHLDVVPTLLELLDLDGPDDLDGVSLAGALRGGAEPPDRPLFAQYSGNPTTGDIRRAVITRRHKYVYDPEDAPELYDLRADPLEMHNLAPDPAHADTLAALHAHCRAWHEAHGDWVSYRPRSL